MHKTAGRRAGRSAPLLSVFIAQDHCSSLPQPRPHPPGADQPPPQPTLYWLAWFIVFSPQEAGSSQREGGGQASFLLSVCLFLSLCVSLGWMEPSGLPSMHVYTRLLSSSEMTLVGHHVCCPVTELRGSLQRIAFSLKEALRGHLIDH